MIWKVIMLTELNGNTSGYQRADGTTVYGTGAIVFEQLCQILYHGDVKNGGVNFDGVELYFFKKEFGRIENKCRPDPPNPLSNRCAEFTHYIYNQYAKGEWFLFRRDWTGKLCTREALLHVLKELSDTKKEKDNVKTALVFVSDSVHVFADMKQFVPERALLPDLSVFYLNRDALKDGAFLLASMQTEENRLKIFDFRSVAENTKQCMEQITQSTGKQPTESEMVSAAIKNRTGCAYALYDVVKKAFQLNESQASVDHQD